MITRLKTTNYRAFEELDIPLTGINLFFGPNNSGKSSILSAIHLLSQTMASKDTFAPILLNANDELGTYKDLVFRNIETKNVSLGLEFTIPRSKNSSPLDIIGFDICFHYRKQRHQIVVESARIYDGAQDKIRTRIAKKGENQLIDYVNPRFKNVPKGSASSGLIGLDHFIPVANRDNRSIWASRRRFNRNLLFELMDIDYELGKGLQQIEYIGPFRKNPERIYPYSGEKPSSVGMIGDKAIDILASDESLRPSKKQNIVSKVSKWFRAAQIAQGVSILSRTDRQYEVKVHHYDTQEEVNLADSGFGCSQILPILVAGYSLEEGSTLVVQQPELHLHPRAEAEVGSFLYDIYRNRKIQLFVESHSEHLMLRIQSYIAEKKLKPEEVNVFYVYPQGETGEKKCEWIPIGEDGYFEKDWPEGFFPDRLKEAKRIARSSERFA